MGRLAAAAHSLLIVHSMCPARLAVGRRAAAGRAAVLLCARSGGHLARLAAHRRPAVAAAAVRRCRRPLAPAPSLALPLRRLAF